MQRTKAFPSLRVRAMDIAQLQQTLRQFAAERDWEQFHTPKNLAMALMVGRPNSQKFFNG